MNNMIKKILKGAGFLLDVFPATDYNRYIPQKNTAKRIEGHWNRVGKNLETATNRFLMRDE